MTTIEDFYDFITKNGFNSSTAMDVGIDAASYWSLESAEEAIKQYIFDHKRELSLDQQDDFYSEFYTYANK